MEFKLKKLSSVDHPKNVNKRLSEAIANGTAERVHKNLKEKKVNY